MFLDSKKKDLKKGGRREGGNDVKFQRPKMNDDDWEKKFYSCLDHFLVNASSDFYHEEIQFKHPDEISDKFAELEEQNLFLIHARQEIEQAFEELKTEEKIMKRELSIKKRGYELNLNKLEDAQKGFGEIQKKSKLMESLSHTKQITKERDGDGEENISELLDVLRDKIIKTYKKVKSENIDFSAKENIDMLSEIETVLDTKIFLLNEIREQNEIVVKKAENAWKVARKERKLKEAGEQKIKEDRDRAEKQNLSKKDKDSSGFKGKIVMQRSKKKSILKKKKEVKEDEIVVDRRRYVGDIV